MHVVVNITSDSEFPFIALLDIVWKRLVKGKRFTSPDTKRPEEPGKRKIKRTEISLPMEPTVVFASKGNYNPTPIRAPTQTWKWVEKRKMEKSFSRMLIPVYQLRGQQTEQHLFMYLAVSPSPSTPCCLRSDRNSYNDRKWCLCFAPWSHGNA